MYLDRSVPGVVAARGTLRSFLRDTLAARALVPVTLHGDSAALVGKVFVTISTKGKARANLNTRGAEIELTTGAFPICNALLTAFTLTGQTDAGAGTNIFGRQFVPFCTASLDIHFGNHTFSRRAGRVMLRSVSSAASRLRSSASPAQ